MAKKRGATKTHHKSEIYEGPDGRPTFDLEPGHMKFAAKRSQSNGKGDGRRPGNSEAYDKNYDRIFGKKVPKCCWQARDDNRDCEIHG